MNQPMNQPAAVTPADAKSFADNKMLSRKDGRVGYVIYNNVEKHNAVSLDMWEAAAPSWTTSGTTRTSPWWW